MRLTLLRHAVEASHFDAAVDAAAALAELVQELVLRRAAMAPLDAHFVLSRGAATCTMRHGRGSLAWIRSRSF